MSYTVEFTPAARRAFAKLPDKIAWAVLEFCEGPLCENPYRVGKPLLGDLAGLHSARRGTYRIVYAIDDHQVVVEVVHVARRADVYGF